METILFLVVGLIIGGTVVFLVGKNEETKRSLRSQATLNKMKEESAAERASLQQQLAIVNNQLENERKAAEDRILSVQRNADDRLLAEKKSAEEMLKAEREHNKKVLEEKEKQHEEAAKAVREEVLNLASKMLTDSKQQLSTENKEKIESLLSP